MHFYLFTTIAWDTEGQSLHDCDLPSVLLLISRDTLDDEDLSIILSESFGFHHNGFTCREFLEPLLRLPQEAAVVVLPSARGPF